MHDKTLNNFIESNSENIIHNINSIKKYIKLFNIKDIKLLINDINLKIDKYQNSKNTYSSLKSLYIDCNKYLLKQHEHSKERPTNKLKYLLDNIKKTQNIKRILFYIKKILNYLDVNTRNNITYDEIIKTVENILYNTEIIKDNNTEYILKLINKCKIKTHEHIKKTELENVLYKTDKNIYNYIYLLKNEDNPLDDKDKVLNFLLNINYDKKCFKEIDKLNLKRGFIQGITRYNKDYLLKYQPNKSVMELVLNCYIKLINNSNFLIPKVFFINSDNSYFYIIEKYNTDLYKYFNILHENNKIMPFNKIIEISQFIMNSIKLLHKHNIIHSDLKLENIVINIDENNDIKDLRIIDFDVGLFNTIPQSLLPIPNNYEKVFNNKKIRGTRIYMLKEKTMSFKNDIFSLGVISLILLYKNIKLLLTIKSKSSDNKKIIIKYQSLLKKLNILKDGIEEYDNKIKMLELIEDYLKKHTIDFNNFKYYKEFIIDCIDVKYNINELIDKYVKILFN